MMQSSIRTHPYHTITLTASQEFIDEVVVVFDAWIEDVDMSILHSSIEYPPESQPIYRLSVPAKDDHGEFAPVEFLLALIYDIAHRAELPEPKVSASTTWHTDELEPGMHAADRMTAELLEIGSYEFVFTMPAWYPLDLFDYVATRVMAEIIVDEIEGRPGFDVEGAGFRGWNSEWIWMPEGQAIQLTIYGRPELDELHFERTLATALSETTKAPYVADWLAENYEDDDEEDEED